MTTNSARGFPEPNTTVERASQSLHLRQPCAAFSWAASASAGPRRTAPLRGARGAELPLAAPLGGLFRGGERLGGAEQYVAAQGRLGEAEIAVVAQRLAERAQRVRELGARVVRGHRRLRGGLAGRRGAEGGGGG